MQSATGPGRQQHGTLPADLLEELDPLAARKPETRAPPAPRAASGVGVLLPPPPSPLKPKPTILAGRDRATGPAATAAATLGPSARAGSATAGSTGGVSYSQLLNDVLLPLPPSQPSAFVPSATPTGQLAAQEHAGGKPGMAAAAAAGVQRPPSKPTVIRPKPRAPMPTVAAATAGSMPAAAGSASTAAAATAAAAPVAAAAAAAAAARPATGVSSQSMSNSTASGAGAPRRPAPPRPAKPAPPRPTKGPSKQVASGAVSSFPSTSPAANGLHVSRSLADLEGLIVVNPSAPPTVTPRTAVDDIAVFPSSDGAWPGLPPRPTLGHPLYHYMIAEPHAVALYSYSASQADELSFKEGDIIMLKRKVNDDWLCGSVDKNEGIFPASFVSVKKDLPPAKDRVDGVVAGPRCVARFDFEAEQDGDLCFVEGDVIQLVERIGLEWFRGTKEGKTGCFPAAFVEVLEDLPPEKHRKEDYGLSSPNQNVAATVVVPAPATAAMTTSFSIDPNLAIATYDFSGRDETELSLKSGDCVYVLGKFTEDWLYGEANGTCGLFPAQFIDHIPPDLPQWSGDTSSATEPGASADGAISSAARPDEMCIALYDFEAQSDGDLTIFAGDRIRILSLSSEEWWEGQLGNRTGIFPAAFVQRL